MRVILGAIMAVALALPVQAATPEASPRPLARGDTQLAALARPKLRPVAQASRAAEKAQPLRPLIRPLSEQEKAMQKLHPRSHVVLASAAASNLPLSLHPVARPEGLATKVMAQRRKERRALKQGAICGDTDLQGDVIGAVPGRIRGCGVQNAVKLRSVAGVGLSQASVMDCGTAKALKAWVTKGVKPAIGNRGGGIASLKVAAHYACRTRNNQPGGKISEHGKGRAIDISAFTLRNGEQITVLKGWRSSKNGPALKKMHRAACGPFGTVLGPNADRFHQDHFHFDTARYRSGSYCR